MFLQNFEFQLLEERNKENGAILRNGPKTIYLHESKKKEKDYTGKIQ